MKKSNEFNKISDCEQIASNQTSFHKYKKSNQGLKPITRQKPKSSPVQSQSKKDQNYKNHIFNNINSINSSHKVNAVHDEVQLVGGKQSSHNAQLDLINEQNFNVINLQRISHQRHCKQSTKDYSTPLIVKSKSFVSRIRGIVNEENQIQQQKKHKQQQQQQQQEQQEQQYQQQQQQQQQYLEMRLGKKQKMGSHQQLAQLQKQENRRFQWKIGDLIGQGSIGQVYRAMNLESGQIFAIKRYNLGLQYLKLDPNQVQTILQEIQIIQQLKHPHIVNYQGHQMDDDYLYIFMEYQSGGSISQLLHKYGPFNVQTIKRYAKQILLGLQCMHDNKIIHKDLKGSNILVNNQGQVKISDFGCSNQIEHTLTANLQGKIGEAVQGSIPWMAPEMIQQSHYGRKADVWGFGCVILEMATARRPWSNYDFDNPIQAILKIGQGDELPYIPDTLPSELDQFIRKCLVRDYKTRPTVKQILEDLFIN